MQIFLLLWIWKEFFWDAAGSIEFGAVFPAKD